MDILKAIKHLEEDGLSEIEKAILTDFERVVVQRLGEKLWQQIGEDLGFAAPTGAGTVIQTAHYYGGGVMIPVELTGPKGTATVDMLIDTGEDASDLLLPASVGEHLGLRDTGAEKIAGVTGAATAYFAQVDVKLGTWAGKVPALVDPTLGQTPPLLGYPFFFTSGLKLTIVPGTDAPTVIIG